MKKSYIAVIVIILIAVVGIGAVEYFGGSDGQWYDIVWFNGAKTDYAEIFYTIDGQAQELIKHNSKGMEIFINPAPAKDYSLNVVYYDSEGNKYE